LKKSWLEIPHIGVIDPENAKKRGVEPIKGQEHPQKRLLKMAEMTFF